MTADGKIARASRHYVPFSSRRDRQRMMELRATADAVMCGARTLDCYPANLGPGAAKYRRLRLKNGLSEYNLRVILSGAGTIDPKAEIFKHRFSPIIILTSERVSTMLLRRLRGLADEVETFGDDELDCTAALRWLRRKWNVKRLLCEGGGKTNGALFRAGLVNEVYLTVCPVLFTGRGAPTLADGAGIERLSDACRLDLMSMKRGGDEMFLRYRVEAPSESRLTGALIAHRESSNLGGIREGV
jgi:5-amino-6-(5-phosphoribosylamino)uracil reductase